MYRTRQAVSSLLSLSPSLLSSTAKPTSFSLTHLRCISAAAPPPPPPTEPAAQESYLSGTSGAYVEDMFESWAHDPKSVHASWDAYFRGGSYQAPPSLGDHSRRNEVPLASILPGLAGIDPHKGKADSHVIDTHLAVQGTIRCVLI